MTSLFGGGTSLVVGAAGSVIPQQFTPIDGQTVFTLSAFSYIPNTTSLWVFVNGDKQRSGLDYTESSGTSFTLNSPVLAIDVVEVIGFPAATLTVSGLTSVVSNLISQLFTATAGQTLFILTSGAYTQGNNSLVVYMNGLKLRNGIDYTETSTTSFTLVNGASLGDELDCISGVTVNASIGAGVVGFQQSGTGAVARTIQDKARESVSVLDFGAVGDGVTDDSAAILLAFAGIKTIGGGTVDFPNAGGTTYLISYGFRIPSNCTVNLNGCTLKATTTFGQGTIPAEGFIGFLTFARPTSESPLAANIGNSSIIGDGATFEMRRNEQTGSIQGYSGVTLKTTDVPAQVDHLKLKNIIVRDLTINYSGYDGVYVQGVQGAQIDNVKTNYALRIGFVGISGDSVTYNNCISSLTVGDNPNVAAGNRGPANSGAGYWNEPDFSWEFMTKWQYNSCRALLNYQTGFKAWNAGADGLFSIELDSCYAYSNVYDATTSSLRSSPGFAQYEVNLNAIGSSASTVTFNNCVADTAQDGGFLIAKGAGAPSTQRIIFNNPVVINCNIANTDSVNRAPIHALSSAGVPTIIVNNPVIIAPGGNTLGYGIYFAEIQNVIVNNPVFSGNFTYKILTTTTPAFSQRSVSSIDPASDNKTGITGTPSAFWKPTRPAAFSQATEPVVATDLFFGELAVWKDSAAMYHGIYSRSDAVGTKYAYLYPTPRRRGVSAGQITGTSIAANSVKTGTITVTGAALGDIVLMTMNAAQNTSLILSGMVTAADTVTWQIANPTVGAISHTTAYVIVNVYGQDV